MAKYIMVYKQKEAFDWTKLPKEQVTKIMSAWEEYLGSLDKVTDNGEIFQFDGRSVSKNGEHDADNLLGGYTVIEAQDFDEALEAARRSPNLSDGGTVEVYEAFAV